jgi:hypothetical protein
VAIGLYTFSILLHYNGYNNVISFIHSTHHAMLTLYSNSLTPLVRYTFLPLNFNKGQFFATLPWESFLDVNFISEFSLVGISMKVADDTDSNNLYLTTSTVCFQVFALALIKEKTQWVCLARRYKTCG